MNGEQLLKLLRGVSTGDVPPAEAVKRLKHLPFEDIGFAKMDGHRHLRNGFSEVIYCKGKTKEQIGEIALRMYARKMNVLGTRCEGPAGAYLKKKIRKLSYDPISRTFALKAHPVKKAKGRVAVLCAGTADLFAAEEAKRTLEFFGVTSEGFYDIGVAGIHRLLSQIKRLDEFDVLIAVAGMEGALPSVLGGLTGKPIVAVPTSVGYGSNFGGVTPLLAMLNSCSEGITVVNIDNGFGAACAALRMISVK